MKKIIFFNHKGGVSKTTSCYNIGWMLARTGKRVMLVDADPQCNLTGLMLDRFDEYYAENSTKHQNIKDGVAPAFEAKPQSIQAVECISTDANQNLFLLAGNANLAEYDASLSFAQTSNNAITTLQNLPGAFNALITATAAKYSVDYVLIDLNPGLSGINQNLFMLSDYFILPTNPDPFSVMSIETLSKVLPRWKAWADNARPSFDSATYPLPNVTPKLIGSLIQKFNIRRGKPSGAFRNSIEDINNGVKTILAPALNKVGMMLPEDLYKQANIAPDFCLEQIPDFQGLIPKSHERGVPVYELSDDQIANTGTAISGPPLDTQKKKRDELLGMFKGLSSKIETLIELDVKRATPVQP